MGSPGKAFLQVFTGTDLVTGEEVNPWYEAGGILLGLVGLRGVSKADEIADLAFGSRQFWTDSVIFDGVKVFQRQDIFDPELMTAWRQNGKTVVGTNLERMRTGRAPIGIDGKSVNLHHMTQRNHSGIAEMTQTFHQKNSKVIHINPNTIPSGIDRKQFDAWKRDYWKNRSEDYR